MGNDFQTPTSQLTRVTDRDCRVLENYIRLKNRTSWFRRRVPQGVRAQIGCTEINIRLGEIERWKAEAVGLTLASQCTILFERARNPRVNGVMLTGELNRLIAKSKDYLSTLYDDHRATMALDGHIVPSAVEDTVRIECEVAAHLIDRYDRGHFAFDDAFVRDRLADSNLNAERDPIEYRKLAGRLTLTLALNIFEKALAKADRNALNENRRLPLSKWRNQAEVLRRQLGLETAAPDIGRQSTSLPSIGTPPEATSPGQPDITITEARPIYTSSDVLLVPSDQLPKIQSEPSSSSNCPIFSVAFDQALDERIETGDLTEFSKRDQLQVRRLWLDIVGDKPIDQYSRADLGRFRSTALKLPRHYWKSEKDGQQACFNRRRFVQVFEKDSSLPSGCPGVLAWSVSEGHKIGFVRPRRAACVRSYGHREIVSTPPIHGPFCRHALQP